MATVADVIVKTLVNFGVKRIYAIPGDSLNPIIDAIRRNRDIKYIQVRHEEGGALSASFESKYSGNLSACMGTSGPGSIHLLNGLYDAKMQHVPVIALTGQIETDLLYHDYFQEVDLVKLFDDVSVFNARITNPDNANYIIWRACREALIKKGVAHVDMPVDVLRMNSREIDLSYNIERPDYKPDLKGAEELINKSKRPLIFIGSGARDAGEKINKLAERIGAPIIYALNGKGIISDGDKKVLGGIGLLGTRPSIKAMSKTDLIIFLGTVFPYSAFINNVKNIQVNNNIEDLNKIMKADVSCLCDVSYFLDNLNVSEKSDKFYDEMDSEISKWKKDIESRAFKRDNIISAEALSYEISKRIEDDAIIVGDTGNVTLWVNRYINAKKNNKFFFSSWLGTMGAGIPGTIGISLASGRKVYGIIGDGSFAMTSMELITIKKYNIPVKLIIYDNHILGMIKLEEEIMGYPEYGVDLYNPDFARLAESVGIKGIRIENYNELNEKLDEFFNYDGPAVLDVITETNETPMPPKLEFRVAERYITSILREKLEPRE
ncbi:thiamine pyrophosphate-dependent enzyme [Picrophilus oshimae]|uniref:Pyruvate oxidase n=1 Tax=Picrophilus torridus (strain ATCC 700027 / DSM 9790 / JCM 10055 / NBRC 100828 / KAW 2/3) TaxID=1122961 RepID=A0A8G2FWM8_PICTO|nr:thiamine pyrophosphate-dependent enzyme [Picrophilus oshimae]SMD30844.1 pyruvate oxidase [Picrophilus oshimae DSM 9789]